MPDVVMSISGQAPERMTIKRPDGTPARAGDLVVGRTYRFDIRSGVLRQPLKSKGWRRHIRKTKHQANKR